jgi:hypothetical protein
MPTTSLTVAPFDPRPDFGCRISGLDSLWQISDDDVAVLAEACAFQAHSLIILPRPRSLEPARELDLYRRLHRWLWPALYPDSDAGSIPRKKCVFKILWQVLGIH